MMKTLGTDLNKIFSALDKQTLLPIKTIYMSQIILIMPYSLMFFLLMRNNAASAQYSAMMTDITYVYCAGLIVFYIILKRYFKRRLNECDFELIETIKVKYPEHSGKTTEQLYILQIQKNINIFYALLDAYALAGVILIIVSIKTGIEMKDYRVWMNAFPFAFTILHSLLNYPDAKKISSMFSRYINTEN